MYRISVEYTWDIEEKRGIVCYAYLNVDVADVDDNGSVTDNLEVLPEFIEGDCIGLNTKVLKRSVKTKGWVGFELLKSYIETTYLKEVKEIIKARREEKLSINRANTQEIQYFNY